MPFCRERKKAAETAFENKNEEELSYVLSKCGPSDKQLVDTIRGMKQQLSKRWCSKKRNSGWFCVRIWPLVMTESSAIHVLLLSGFIILLCLCKALDIVIIAIFIIIGEINLYYWNSWICFLAVYSMNYIHLRSPNPQFIMLNYICMYRYKCETLTFTAYAYWPIATHQLRLEQWTVQVLNGIPKNWKKNVYPSLSMETQSSSTLTCDLKNSVEVIKFIGVLSLMSVDHKGSQDI